MAQHARLVRELGDDGRPLVGEHRLLRGRQHDAAIPFDEMADEEVELPRELLDVERDAVGQMRVGGELGAAPLQQLDQRDRLAIERRVLARRRGAQMRLQRHVAQILLRDDAERVGMIEHERHRQRHLPQQLRHVGEGQRGEVDRPGVQRQHDRRVVGRE